MSNQDEDTQMKQTINFSQFCDAFAIMGRKDNFSYEGLKVLYNCLLQSEEDSGQEIELDVIALCLEYEELSIDYIIANYNLDDKIAADMEEEEKAVAVEEYLTNATYVCGRTNNNTIVFCNNF
jgi:hypothetical protein